MTCSCTRFSQNSPSTLIVNVSRNSTCLSSTVNTIVALFSSRPGAPFIVSQLIRFSSVTEYASDDQCFVSFHNTILVYMQFRLTNSQRYLVVGLVAFTKYRCEFVNLNCIFTTIFAVNLARMNKMLSYRRETELQGTLVLAESGRLELRDNILLIL